MWFSHDVDVIKPEKLTQFTRLEPVFVLSRFYP